MKAVVPESIDPNETARAILTPYLEATASSTNTSALRAVVGKFLQDSEVFEGYDQVKAKSTVQDDKLYATLELFSYGTLQDYHADSAKYMSLSEAQLSKLRQLTVLSLLQQTLSLPEPTTVVPYQSIQRVLEWKDDSQRDIEQLLGQLLASRVVSGKLCQKQQAFILRALHRPRDVHPSRDMPALKVAMQELAKHLQESKQQLLEQQKKLDHEEALKIALEQEMASRNDMDTSDFAGPHQRSGAARRPKRTRGGFASLNERSYFPFGFGM